MNKNAGKKQKRTYKRTVKPLVPAVDSNDIRRQYAAMFINTVNSSDPERFSKFLTERCTPDIRYLRTLCVENEQTNNQHDIVKQSTDDVYQWWVHRCQLFPDLILKIVDDVSIYTYNNTLCSKVSAKISACTTKIYDVDIVDMTNASIDVVKTAQLAKHPIVCDYSGEFTLFLNENMMINNIEMHLIGHIGVGDDSTKSNIVYY